jgi:plasmid stabilization system protein ParE
VPAAVSFHPAAAQELDLAYRWYRDRYEPGAKAFAVEVDVAIHRIASSPDRWPRIDATLHRYVLKRFPFSVIYRVKEKTVEIVAVAHARRRPGFWQLR